MADGDIQVKGTALLKAGLDDVAWGLIKDYTEGTEGDKEEVKNGQGNVVSVLYTNPRRKVSATFAPLAAAQSTDPPKLTAQELIGKSLSLGGPNGSVTIFIESAELSGTQGGAPSFKVEGYYYPYVSAGNGG